MYKLKLVVFSPKPRWLKWHHLRQFFTFHTSTSGATKKAFYTCCLPKTCKLQKFFTSAMRGSTRICVTYIVPSEGVCKRASTYLKFIETPLALQGNQLPICWKTKMATKFEEALQRHLYSVTDKAALFLLPGKLPTFDLIWFDLIWSDLIWFDIAVSSCRHWHAVHVWNVSFKADSRKTPCPCSRQSFMSVWQHNLGQSVDFIYWNTTLCQFGETDNTWLFWLLLTGRIFPNSAQFFLCAHWRLFPWRYYNFKVVTLLC